MGDVGEFVGSTGEADGVSVGCIVGSTGDVVGFFVGTGVATGEGAIVGRGDSSFVGDTVI